MASKSAEGAIWYVHICMALAYLYDTCILVWCLHICTISAYLYGICTWHIWTPHSCKRHGLVPVSFVTVSTLQVQDEFMAPLYHKCVTVDVVD